MINASSSYKVEKRLLVDTSLATVRLLSSLYAQVHNFYTDIKQFEMNNLKVFSLSLIFCLLPFSANAQSGCVRVDQIAKWEVLDLDKTVVYDAQGNTIAFIIFSQGYLKKSGESFRFFSPTICRNDRVQTSSRMDTIFSVEPIRK